MGVYKYVSFYISKNEIDNLNKVKQFCRRHNISFSELMRNVLQAIAVSITNVQVNVNTTNININAPININVIQKDTKDDKALELLDSLIAGIERVMKLMGQRLATASTFQTLEIYRWGIQQIAKITREIKKKIPKLLLKQ